MDHSPPGSSVHGVLQARILGWVPFPSPGDLPNPGIQLRSPALQADSSLSHGERLILIQVIHFFQSKLGKCSGVIRWTFLFTIPNEKSMQEKNWTNIVTIYTSVSFQIRPDIGKDPDLGKIWGQEFSLTQRMKWLNDITDSVDMSLSRHWEIVKDREACWAAVHGVAEIWM